MPLEWVRLLRCCGGEVQPQKNQNKEMLIWKVRTDHGDDSYEKEFRITIKPPLSIRIRKEEKEEEIEGPPLLFQQALHVAEGFFKEKPKQGKKDLIVDLSPDLKERTPDWLPWLMSSWSSASNWIGIRKESRSNYSPGQYVDGETQEWIYFNIPLLHHLGRQTENEDNKAQLEVLLFYQNAYYKTLYC